MVGVAISNLLIVGFPVKKSERMREALSARGMLLVPKCTTVNLSPSDLLKEGANYDPPIALALFAAMIGVDARMIDEWLALSQLVLDGHVVVWNGLLLAALDASERLICSITMRPKAAGRATYPSGPRQISSVCFITCAAHRLRKPSHDYFDAAGLSSASSPSFSAIRVRAACISSAALGPKASRSRSSVASTISTALFSTLRPVGVSSVFCIRRCSG